MIRRNSLLAITLLGCLGLTGCSSLLPEPEEAPPLILDTERENDAVADAGSETELVTEAETKAETETEPPLPEKERGDFTICIDPAMTGTWVDTSAEEPIGPDSSETAPRGETSPASASGTYEFRLAMDFALVLRDKLTEDGYQTVLTREDNDTDISNSERAAFASESGADLIVSLRANVSDDGTLSGAMADTASSDNEFLSEGLISEGQRLGQSLLESYCQATGIENLGLEAEDDLALINYSSIPTAVLRLGYISNDTQEAYLLDPENQQTMASAISAGIDSYLGIDENGRTNSYSTGAKSSDSEKKGAEAATTAKGPIPSILEDYLTAQEEQGEVWTVAYGNLKSGEQYGYLENEQVDSAELLGVYIMGAVYKWMCYPPSDGEMIEFGQEYPGQLRETIEKMVQNGDTDAANLLVERLGGGDFGAGIQIVNQFCKDNGYTHTTMGHRLGEASDGSSGNITSASDCRKILTDIFHGSLINEEASAKMLEILQGSTRLSMIPEGLSGKYTTGNCVGELGSKELGYTENDMAICLKNEEEGFVLVVLSENLDGGNRNAIDIIYDISYDVSEWYSRH